MWKTFALIVTGFGLLLALPAAAEEKPGSGRQAPDNPRPKLLQFKGVLRHEQGARTRDPEIPFDYWKLEAAGTTYYLDLRGPELPVARMLVGRPVVVIGSLDLASPTVHVTSLRADEFVQETVNVEVRGRLVSIREDPRHYKPLEYYQGPPLVEGRLAPPERGWIVGWRIFLGKKSYELDFGSPDHKRTVELLELAEKLDGHGVVVTGTQVGDVIHVTGLKADEGAYHQTVGVKIQGVLRCMLEPPSHDWSVTAGGKRYRLQFPSNDSDLHVPFQLRAERLAGKTVVVTGTLKDGVVTVTGLWAAEPGEPGVGPVEKKMIDGVWDSNWGPVTIRCGVEDSEWVPITGSWVQGPGRIGVITSGTFDPVNGVLEFAFDEPWHNQSGTAELRLSADGKTLRGTWKFTRGGGGTWTMTRL
jgi:hypothetical protein